MVEQLVYDLETDILIKIAKHLSTGAIESAEWQARKLGELGLLNYEVRKLISKYRGRILIQTSREVRESADQILSLIRKHSPKGKKTIAAKTKEMRDIIDTWISSATMKTNFAMASLAESAGRKYVASVTKASLSVVTGTETLQRSVFQAIGELERLDAFVSYDKLGNKRTWTPEGYVKMVVRDNQRRASTATMFQAAAEGDTDLIEVSSHLGARPKCAPYQGKIYSISGNHPKYPPLSSTSYGEIDGLNGINCVLEGTLISCPAERAAYRRKYTGEIITIRTALGHELSVTPNHPILTDKGWVKANSLTIGCNVVSRANLDGDYGISPNPYHRETAIENIFDSLLHRGNVFRLPASSCNFHGDVPDHEVDVVFKNGFLLNRGKLSVRQHREEYLLHYATEFTRTLFSFGALNKIGVVPLHTTDGLVSRKGDSIAPSLTTTGMNILNNIRFVFTNWYSKIIEIFSNSSLTNTNLCGDFILPKPGVIYSEQINRIKSCFSEQVTLPISSHIDSFTIKTIQNCLDGTMIVPCDGSNRNTGEIQLDRIIDIKRDSTQSSFVHVYNLQTETGWYFSNGIISHNCGHIFYPFWEGVSEKTYEPYPAKQNDKVYEQSQEQRAAERKIRYYKRKEAIAKATTGGEAQAKKWHGKVRESQAEMRTLLEKTGRTRQRDREAIYT